MPPIMRCIYFVKKGEMMSRNIYVETVAPMSHVGKSNGKQRYTGCGKPFVKGQSGNLNCLTERCAQHPDIGGTRKSRNALFALPALVVAADLVHSFTAVIAAVAGAD
jgi:hypothetical protein